MRWESADLERPYPTIQGNFTIRLDKSTHVALPFEVRNISEDGRDAYYTKRMEVIVADGVSYLEYVNECGWKPLPTGLLSLK